MGCLLEILKEKNFSKSCLRRETSFDFVILNFFQVKARTPLKRLMRSKGALKDQSRLIQHFSKELQTANFRFKHHGKIVRLALFTIVFFCENAEVNF